MKYNFTDGARQALLTARNRAIGLAHAYVGTEHILLGLMDERNGVAVGILTHLSVEPERVQKLVVEAVSRGKGSVGGGELPYTPGAKKTLQFAMAAARDLGHSYVGTEHLLIGVLREEKGIAAQVLMAMGATVERVSAVVREGVDLAAGQSAVPAAAQGALATDREGQPVWFLELDAASDKPIYEQIIARVEEAVATGRLVVGERLPTVRQLAEELGVAPGTVARAYSHLERQGVLVTEGAKGTRVAAQPAASAWTESLAAEIEQRLRAIVVQAYHLGGTADDLRGALEGAMIGIYDG